MFTYTNQTEETITIKLNWNSDEKTLYNSLIGSFAVGAMCIGTPISGRLMKIGRLRVLDLAAIVGIIGSALTMILDIKALLAAVLILNETRINLS